MDINHGGARDGAGRPKKADARPVVSLRVNSRVKEFLETRSGIAAYLGTEDPRVAGIPALEERPGGISRRARLPDRPGRTHSGRTPGGGSLVSGTIRSADPAVDQQRRGKAGWPALDELPQKK